MNEDIQARIDALEKRLARVQAHRKRLMALLREARGRQRMYQSAIAKKTGVTSQHINAIVNGHGNPSAKLAVRLEEATGIDRSIWLWGTQEERREAWKKAKEAKA